MAAESLALTGLDREVRQILDENGKLVAADRISQRMEAWLKAQRARNRLLRNPNPDLIETIVDLALSEGFFSVWMTVFEDRPDMRRRFINAFPGTAQSCFDANTALISKRSDNGLPGAGKI